MLIPTDCTGPWLRTITKSGGVTIVTRQGLTTFAEGLDDREVRYLHDMVRRALVGARSG